MNVATDKWKLDIKPCIQASRYASYLPTSGRGSQGGLSELISFTNGAFVRFMSGGGDDGTRASFTSRVLVVTETDKLDEQGGRSREADKLTQMEQRTRAYGNRRRIYLECTPSFETGRIWEEYQQGTATQLLIRCQHCDKFVLPEREQFTGWENASSEAEAREKGAFACPECGGIWSERDRINAVRDCKAVHTRESLTLGFRWSAVHNLFWSMADIAEFEWKSARRQDRDSAEKEMLQFHWARPWSPPREESPLPEITVSEKAQGRPRGRVPEGMTKIIVGVDVGKWRLHWTVAAWAQDGTGAVLDYGQTETGTDELGVEKGILAALNELYDIVGQGYAGPSGQLLPVTRGLVDAGWNQELIQRWCKAKGWAACKGFGVTQRMGGRNYRAPKTTGSVVVWIGEQCHAVLQENGLRLIEHNTDFGKSWLHARLNQPTDQPGALTLWGAPADHISFVKHLTAEQLIEEKGILKWQSVRNSNHWLDSTALSGLGARIEGVTVAAIVRPQAPVLERKAAVHVQQPRQQQQQRYRPISARKLRTRY